MTNTDSETRQIELRQIDSGRVDDGYRQWPRLLLTLLIGLLVGALVGGLYGASRPATHEASTALSVQPDPTIDITSQNNNQNSTPTLDATAYIQSQLVILNGRQLVDQVQTALSLPAKPTVTATQVGQTYVVEIVADAASEKRAAAIARETGARYIAIRTGQLRTEVNGLLTSTNQQLTGVSKSLAASQRGRSTTAALTPSQTALQTEYERLLSVRSTLNALLQQSNRVVTVVSPARATSAALSETVKDTLGGALLGAVLALVIFFIARRSRHRVRSLADLAALDVPVVLPVLPKPTLSQLRRGDVRTGTETRVLAARLIAEAGVERRPLVFVGTDSGAGTTSVAESVAAALGSTGPVLLVRAGDESSVDAWATVDVDSSVPAPTHAGVVRSTIPGVWLPGDTGIDAGSSPGHRLVQLLDEAALLGWQVVVDAGSVSTSDVATRCARAGAALVLVVDRGRATPSAVLSATELFEATGSSMIGAVLNDPAGVVGRRLQRRSSSVSPRPGRHAESATITSVPDADDDDPSIVTSQFERTPGADESYDAGFAHRPGR